MAERLDRKGVKFTGTLTGDRFDTSTFNFFKLRPKEDSILLTINGVLTTRDKAKEMLDSVKMFPWVGENAKGFILNETHGVFNFGAKWGAGDFTQALINEMGIRDFASVRAAIQIELAAVALRKQQVDNPSIYIVAHSQGTMVFLRAMSLLSEETKRMIHFYGNGGEVFVPVNGLKTAKNFLNDNDIIPFLAAGPQRFRTFLQRRYNRGDYNIYSLGLGGDGKRIPNAKAHSWMENYAPLYSIPNKRGDNDHFGPTLGARFERLKQGSGPFHALFRSLFAPRPTMNLQDAATLLKLYEGYQEP